MQNIPIDWAAVDTMNVAALAVAVFVLGFIANVISMGNRFVGAILTAILFAAFYVGWTYWWRALAGPMFAPPV